MKIALTIFYMLKIFFSLKLFKMYEIILLSVEVKLAAMIITNLHDLFRL